jgi:hypothetical protein
VTTKNTLSYGARLDWGNKTLPPKYVKLYGVVVLLLTCLYLWIFHKYNASALCQASAAALAVALVVLLALRWNKGDRINQFLFWFILIQTAVQAISLLRYF